MKLNHIKSLKNTQSKIENGHDSFHETLEFSGGENKSLAYASNKIKMR